MLLERLREARLQQLAQTYQRQVQNSVDAREKLAALSAFAEESSTSAAGVTDAARLRETQVFQARLQQAVAGQATVCEQIDSQVTLAKTELQAAHRQREVLGRVLHSTRKTLKAQTDRRQQRADEDQFTAGLSRKH